MRWSFPPFGSLNIRSQKMPHSTALGFSAFVPLYVTHLGLSGSGVVFAEYAFAVLAVRIFGARLPDRLGSRRGASMALVLR